MSAFLTKLVIESSEGLYDNKWVIIEPLIYQSDLTNTTFTVPRGFPTDLASVPRLPVVYYLFGGIANEAAALHDFLYVSHLVSRTIADAVLKEACAAIGVSAWRRWLMWAGVRIAGGKYYG